NLSGVAAARHCRISARDRAPLRRTQEVDPRARGGNAVRHLHSARHPEERVRRRPRNGGDLRNRHACERTAAAQAPDGTVKVLVEGAHRAKVVKYTDCSEYYEAEAVALGDTMGERVEAKALARAVTNEFESYAKLNKRVPPEVVGIVQQIEDYAELADTVASHLAL